MSNLTIRPASHTRPIQGVGLKSATLDWYSFLFGAMDSFPRAYLSIKQQPAVYGKPASGPAGRDRQGRATGFNDTTTRQSESTARKGVTVIKYRSREHCGKGTSSASAPTNYSIHGAWKDGGNASNIHTKVPA
ncbi:hypothetical protein EMPG_17329 [Blastomyces silverae]|uniref:Uncharacterized protein n=1 Tax=Blastomyces silverae TaxID=2060906 RepID=A0A0H1B847_9EURO|nr:hypothetical protein EMPG_17329 [Blastomyces silverae]